MPMQANVFDNFLGFARDNEPDAIKALVVQHGCPPTYANKMGQSALHIGAIWGSVDAVKTLLELRADPNAQNQLRGSTPLHAAAMGKGPADKRAECVKLMIEFKGLPNMADHGGELPLDCASDEVVRLALGAAPLILHKAVQTRQLAALVKACEQLEHNTTDLTLETTDHTGWSALHLAVAQGFREGVEYLLKAKADPSSPDNMQRTPLHAAILQGNHRILQLLIKARADAAMADSDPDYDPRFVRKQYKERMDEHRTPLHYAAELGNVLAIRLLLRHRADPNAADAKCQTPLHLCLGLRASADADGIAEQQLDVGTGVRIAGLQKRPEWNGRLGSIFGPQAASNAEGPGRWPVLLEDTTGAEAAATDGVLLKAENLQQLPEETLDLLLEARADVNLGNRVTGETFTVLHEAARIGDATLVVKLLAAHACLDQQDTKLGLSALHLAARAKQHEIVKLLVGARADTGQATGGGKTAAELAETNGASAATLAILRGDAALPPEEPMPRHVLSNVETIHDLTPEQRRLLFID